MRLILILLFGFSSYINFAQGGVKELPRTNVSFQKLVLFNDYLSEGATIGDLDADGHQDIVAGSLWWKGPDFKQSFSLAPVKIFPTTGPGVEGYSTSFFTFLEYINDDKYLDIIQLGLPGTNSAWVKNPGVNSFSSSNTDKRIESLDGQEHVCNESPQLVDVIGDAKKELLSFSNGRITIGIPNNEGWDVLNVSHHDPKRFPVFIHGLGVGDINSDGLMDVIEKNGWWEQPENWDMKSNWINHEYAFSPDMGGAQMFSYDVDGDKDMDVVTSMNGHSYGLSWHEQIKNKFGETTFIEHKIMTDTVSGNAYGVCFSQLHSLSSVDIDNDGILDIVTGKCYYAHNGRDPGAEDPSVLYWFKTTRNIDGSVEFIPYLIDSDSGVGRQITSGDLNKDGKSDLSLIHI